MNKAVHVALGLVLGLLAGLAIGVAVTQRAPAPMVADALPANDEPHADTPPPEALPTETSPEPTRESAKKPAAGSSLADLIAATETPELPRGDGVIAGHVRLESGEGLAGVEILLSPRYPEKRIDSGATLEERVRDDIRYQRWTELSRVTAVTDADGAYRFESLSETARYNISATLEGWKIEPVDTRGSVQAGATVNFQATASIRLQVEVRMPDGSLAKYGRVSYDQVGSNRSSGTVFENGSGELQLSPGTWKIRGSQGNDLEYQGEEVLLEIVAGDTPETLVLQLAARAGVRGTVVVPKLYKNPRFEVLLVKDPPAEAPGDLEEMRRTRPKQAQTRNFPFDSGPSTFSILEVQPGAYRLLLVMDNAIVDWKDVSVAAELVEVELSVPEPEAEDYIICRATGPDEKPVTDLSVTLRIRRGTSWYGGGAAVVWPQDGILWVKRRLPDVNQRNNAEDWWYELVVSNKQYGTLTRRVERDDHSVQELQFEQAATLVLTVTGYNEHESRDKLGWRVLVAGSQSEWISSSRREADSSPFTFGPYQPGSYEIVLVHRDGRRVRNPIYSETIVLAVGENQHTMAMPLLYSLKLRCKDGQQAADINLDLGGKRVYLDSSDRNIDGAMLEIPLLTAGEYDVYTRHGRMKISVPAADAVEFAPRMYDCLEVTSIKAGGLIEQAGLRNGDRVFKVDGAEFGDVDMFRTQLMASLARDSTTWTLVREGVVIEVVLNGKAVDEAHDNRRENGENLGFKGAYRND